MGIFSLTAERARTSSEEAMRLHIENVILDASREGDLEVYVRKEKAPAWIQEELQEAGYTVSEAKCTNPEAPSALKNALASEMVRICW